MLSGKNDGRVKAVIDTNTLVSGLLWRGNPALVLDAFLDNRIEVYLSEELLHELADVLQRPRLAAKIAQRGLDSAWSCDFIRERCFTIFPSAALELPILRDRKDLPVLMAARAAAVDLVITGDKDLLILGRFGSSTIVDAAQAVRMLGLC
jgi:putative PIN family toxin of toxin-antitoxin system